MTAPPPDAALGTLDRLVLDAVADLVVLFEDGAEGLRSVLVSGSWARAVGRGRDGWSSLTPEQVLPPVSAEAVGAAGGTPVVFDDVVPTVDGPRPVEATVSTTETDGRRFVLWVARDVAAQRRAERDLRWEHDDLRRSNSDLAEFATVASHDLKEPLRMITAYLELIERRYGDALDERGHQYLGFARDGAERLRAMTDGLLRYAKIRTTAVEIEPVDLAVVVASIEAELAVLLREAGAHLEVTDLPVVPGNATLLQTLLQNLVSNAIKFSTGQPRVRIGCTAVGGSWELTVDDDGIGIPPERRPDAFTMFRRLHAPSTYPGSGMGLAVCRGVVDALGGEISLHDSPMGGTRVLVRLPRHRTKDTP